MKTRIRLLTLPTLTVCLAALVFVQPHRLSAEVLEGPVTNPTNGHTYYLLENSNWTDAEAEAVLLGGHLATVNDEAENDWLSGLWGADRWLWIGLNDTATEGMFEWVSGDSEAYRNWNSGEPSGGPAGEDYVYIISTSLVPGGRWNDVSDLSSWPGEYLFYGVVEVDEGVVIAPIIIEQPESRTSVVGSPLMLNVTAIGDEPLGYHWFKDGAEVSGAVASTLVVTNVKLSDAGDYHATVSNAAGVVTSAVAMVTIQTSPPPVLVGPVVNPTNGHSYYLLENSTWTAAESQAMLLGGHLATINNQAENDWLSGLWGEDRWLWIGLNDAAAEGMFEWVSGDSEAYRNWNSGEPSGGPAGEDYAYIISTSESPGGRWNDVSDLSSWPSGYLLHGVVEVNSAVMVSPTILDQPQSKTNLVGITLMLSVTAIGTEPLSYQWFKDAAEISGATASTLVLADVQLADGGSYVVTVSNLTGSITSSPAVVTIRAAELPGVLAGPVINPANGHAYYLLEQSTWVEAQNTATGLAGNLTSITDAEEQAWVFSQFGRWGRQGLQLWIGLYDADPVNNATDPLERRAEFVWVNGDPVIYANWQEGQPDNYEELGEYYVHMRQLSQSNAGMWNDASDTEGNPLPFNGVVETEPPAAIAAGPESMGSIVGLTVQFEVQATGALPLSYQWRFDGTDLVGATSATLVMTNVQLSQAGTYSVIVTNAFGTATSTNALLTVSESPTDGLVAYYPFDGGDATDATGQGHDGVVTGATWSAEGVAGGSFSFDGNDDYIRIADHPSFNPDVFTVTHWVKLSEPTEFRGSFAKARAFTPWLYRTLFNGGDVHFSIRVNGDQSGGLSTPFTSHFEQWTMVTVMYNGTNTRMYLNDQLVTQKDFAAGPYSSSSDVLIGAGAFDTDGETPVQLFQGQIDEVRFYNRVLSGEEIATLYQDVIDGWLPPVIAAGPDSIGAAVGDAVQFEVQATGAVPLDYQWHFNGTNLVGATSATLLLSNVQLSQAGTYSVDVSNAYGSVTSSNALLTVSEPPADGLVAYYPFDEDNAADASGQGHDGVVTGATWSAEGAMGGTYSFDGSDDYIRIADHPDLNPEVFTVTHWVKLSQPNTLRGSFAKTRAFDSSLHRVQFYSNNDVQFHIRVDGDQSGMLTTSFTPYFDQWTMVTVQYNGTHTRMYLNDQLASESPFSAGPLVNVNDILIGAGVFDTDGETPLQFFQGQIDEVRLYNRELSGEEIATLYQDVVDGWLSPVIVTGPESKDADVGQTVQFEVQATGAMPLAYQWRFNGTNLVEATSSALVLSNIQLSQAGTYSVDVSNLYGSVTSSNALLTLSEPPVDGLVAYYPFDEDSATDATGRGHDGVVTGATWSAEGAMGGSYSFDGNDDYIRIADHPDLNPEVFTVTHWVKLSQSTGIRGSFAKTWASASSLHRTLFIGGDVHFSIRVNGDQSGSLNTPFTSHFEQWTMVTVMYNGTNTHMYLNDQLATQKDFAAGPYSSPADILIGAGAFDADGETPIQLFQGQIDEVRFYNRELSGEEIATLYQDVIGGWLPPVITAGPDSAEAMVGETVQFEVQATGAVPLAYQWRFNGTDLAGATSATLLLSNVQISQAGAYSVDVSNAYGSVTSSNAQLTVTPVPTSQVVVVSAGGASGSSIALPIQLISLGTENALGFSLEFDPDAVSVESALLGSDVAGAAMLVNYSQTNNGRLGLALSLSTEEQFPVGTNEVAVIVFSSNPVTNALVTPIAFGDQPTVREVVDALAAALPASYQGGTISLDPVQYEGDVAPRGNVDRALTVADWVQAGRFVAALDTPDGEGEFQRADIAPRTSLGDGRISIIDWVQAGRYSVGLDPVTVAGGPDGPVQSSSGVVHAQNGESVRVVSVSATALVAGLTNSVAVDLGAVGDESALAFSLQFDSAQMTYVGTTLGAGATGAALNINTSSAGSGELGFALSLPIGSVFETGANELVSVQFGVSAEAEGSTVVSFSDSPVWKETSDALATPLPTAYQAGTLSITPLLPMLSITFEGEEITLTWSEYFSDFVLQQSTNAGVLPADWSELGVTPENLNGNYRVTLTNSRSSAYYRLHQQ